MKWAELNPQARARTLFAAFVLLALLVGSVFVSSMLERRAEAHARLAQTESRLEAAEREIESIAPPDGRELAAWQASFDELISRLGPESELPLLLESLTRLADGQEVEVFLTSGRTERLDPSIARIGRRSPSEAVFASVPGARSVVLNARIFGDYEDISRFLSQAGRLGWVVAIDEVQMERRFPEVVADARMTVIFRADAANAEADDLEAASPTRGARGRDHG